jgi:hypothetical protein
LDEELEAARIKELKLKDRLERDKEQREIADKLAETLAEFWEGLLGETIGEMFAQSAPTWGAAEEPEGGGIDEITGAVGGVSPEVENTVTATVEMGGQQATIAHANLTIPVFDEAFADDEADDAAFQVIDELIASGELVLM